VLQLRLRPILIVISLIAFEKQLLCRSSYFGMSLITKEKVRFSKTNSGKESGHRVIGASGHLKVHLACLFF
jgi:hypothetical protein